MRLRLGLVVTLLCASSALCAQEIRTFRAAEAARHVGEFATVIGTVSGVNISESGDIFIDIGSAYPHEPFAAFVPNDATTRLRNPKKLEGHVICVTGQITAYKGRPEIIVTDASQVEIKW